MAIPKYDEWLTNTKEGKTDSRGSNMTQVDGFLQAYWDAMEGLGKGAIGWDGVAVALINMIKGCNSWLKLKREKSDTMLFGWVTKDVFIQRRSAVFGLASEAMKDLQAMLTTGLVGGNNLKKLRAQLYYENNRYKTFSGGEVTRTTTQSLGKAYEVERKTWEKSNKTANISGSLVHGFFEEHAATLPHGYIVDTTYGPDAPQIEVSKKLRKMLNKNVEALDAGDWAVVQEFLIANKINDATAKRTQCLYLKKEQRLLALALINDRGLFENYDGNLITAGDVGTETYAMDRYGAFYTGKQIGAMAIGTAIQKEGKYVNHSSFTSGKEVICAGNVIILRGQLTAITNNSGHYKPTKENLEECLKVLQKEGADLSQTVVTEMRFSSTGRMDHTYNSVANFLSGAAANTVTPGH